MTNGEHLWAWLTAWTDAVTATWPARTRPHEVETLVRFVTGLLFCAPEAMHLKAGYPWSVFKEIGDTPEGRAAVALASILHVWGRR